MGGLCFLVRVHGRRRKGDGGNKEKGQTAGYYYSFRFGKSVFVTHLHGMEMYLTATCTLTYHDRDDLIFFS